MKNKQHFVKQTFVFNCFLTPHSDDNLATPCLGPDLQDGNLHHRQSICAYLLYYTIDRFLRLIQILSCIYEQLKCSRPIYRPIIYMHINTFDPTN